MRRNLAGDLQSRRNLAGDLQSRHNLAGPLYEGPPLQTPVKAPLGAPCLRQPDLTGAPQDALRARCRKLRSHRR